MIINQLVLRKLQDDDNYRWDKTDEYPEKFYNGSNLIISFRNLDIEIDPFYLGKFAYLDDIDITKYDTSKAKESIYNNYSGREKSKYISSGKGILYYLSNSFWDSTGDIRLIYSKLKTNNKISVLGEKKDNTIIPFKRLKDYEEQEIFKAVGDTYNLNDFYELIENEYFWASILLGVFGFLFLSIGIFIVYKSIKSNN